MASAIENRNGFRVGRNLVVRQDHVREVDVEILCHPLEKVLGIRRIGRPVVSVLRADFSDEHGRPRRVLLFRSAQRDDGKRKRRKPFRGRMLRRRRRRRRGYARIGFLLLGDVAVKAEIAQQGIGGVEDTGNGQNGADYEFVFHHASPAFGTYGRADKSDLSDDAISLT